VSAETFPPVPEIVTDEPPVYSDEPAEQDHSPGAHGSPRGAAAFAFLMLFGYAVYLTLVWLEVIGRGN
jgi:hypothetical protein